MSRADRKKWNERYRAGAFAERTHPSALLEDWIDRLPLGRALDLACGAGRNYPVPGPQRVRGDRHRISLGQGWKEPAFGARCRAGVSTGESRTRRRCGSAANSGVIWCSVT